MSKRANTQTALWIISTQPSGKVQCLKEWSDAHYSMVSWSEFHKRICFVLY